MNKVILMGRLTRDAEIRYAQGGQLTCNSKIFTCGRQTLQQECRGAVNGFHQLRSFWKDSRIFERFGRKGTKFVVEGRIQTGSYTNKDGQKVYTTDVVVENAEFAESKSAASGNAGGFAPADRPAPSQAAGDGFMNIPDGIDEELPFN